MHQFMLLVQKRLQRAKKFKKIFQTNMKQYTYRTVGCLDNYIQFEPNLRNSYTAHNKDIIVSSIATKLKIYVFSNEIFEIFQFVGFIKSQSNELKN